MHNIPQPCLSLYCVISKCVHLACHVCLIWYLIYDISVYLVPLLYFKHHARRCIYNAPQNNMGLNYQSQIWVLLQWTTIACENDDKICPELKKKTTKMQYMLKIFIFKQTLSLICFISIILWLVSMRAEHSSWEVIYYCIVCMWGKCSFW